MINKKLGKLILALIFLPLAVFASHLSIDTKNRGYHWAWNDIINWIDFHNNVEVKNNELRGWANSNFGPIVLNCQTTPSGDICYQSNFKVSNTKGALDGWAWNDVIGWISFAGTGYGVTIEPAGDGQNSFFKGWAWNDVIGWISFNCENQNLCGTYPTYRVQTGLGNQSLSAFLDSNVFDTQSSNPFYNYILWRGVEKTGTSVQLQIATSNSVSGPWNFGSAVTIAANQKLAIDSANQGKRYIKYRVTLNSDNWQEDSPEVEDVIINYSP